ncbi:hypothetical protein H5410_048098 [Solanum commersonii]|uniref:Uncharacterized protein n=1 Tax=Solanum commersonii TaxID=4109 RepID=A0A9J5XKW7_SOLCO|nr:hypothetical protein H5410_048098 [Solanum commersonii]
MLGHISCVAASDSSESDFVLMLVTQNIVKRVVIDYAFNFLKRNLRQSSKVFDIPHKRMLKKVSNLGSFAVEFPEKQNHRHVGSGLNRLHKLDFEIN